jgi:hypothetical protein
MRFEWGHFLLLVIVCTAVWLLFMTIRQGDSVVAPKRAPRNRTEGSTAKTQHRLVDRPSDSLSDNPSFHIGIGPADRPGMLGIASDVCH